MKTYDQDVALLPWSIPKLVPLPPSEVQGGDGPLPETDGGFWNSDGDVPCS